MHKNEYNSHVYFFTQYIITNITVKTNHTNTAIIVNVVVSIFASIFALYEII
jgi:hypothetical protein